MEPYYWIEAWEGGHPSLVWVEDKFRPIPKYGALEIASRFASDKEAYTIYNAQNIKCHKIVMLKYSEANNSGAISIVLKKGFIS